MSDIEPVKKRPRLERNRQDLLKDSIEWLEVPLTGIEGWTIAGLEGQELNPTLAHGIPYSVGIDKALILLSNIWGKRKQNFDTPQLKDGEDKYVQDIPNLLKRARPTGGQKYPDDELVGSWTNSAAMSGALPTDELAEEARQKRQKNDEDPVHESWVERVLARDGKLPWQWLLGKCKNEDVVDENCKNGVKAEITCYAWTLGAS